MKTFLSGFDPDIKENLKQQISVRWTYASNAIEGSSLTLGETDFVIREGITISGKPLKDFNDAENHYSAISKIYQLAASDEKLTKETLFLLHKSLMPNNVMDIYKPIGAWKNDINGTYQIDETTNRSYWIEYPSPAKIPFLMERWIELFNSQKVQSQADAVKVYSKLHTLFVSIHPFFDGNGRMARLVSNIPVLRGGFAPIVIDSLRRKEYIGILSKIHKDNPEPDFTKDYPQMESFIQSCCQEIFDCIEQARDVQNKRNLEREKDQSQDQGMSM